MLLVGAALAGLAVAAGAFGAHLLKPILDGTMLAVFETGVRYHMYHALAPLRDRIDRRAGLDTSPCNGRMAVRDWHHPVFWKLVRDLAERDAMGWCVHTAWRCGPHSRLGAFGMDCCQDLAIAYGVQAAVRLPLIDPQPP
jgi:hypothetical protein